MSPDPRRRQFILPAAWGYFALAVSLAVYVLHAGLTLSTFRAPERRATSVQARAWPEVPDVDARNWALIEGPVDPARSGRSELAARFRLAGTFFAREPGGQENRKAVLDDLKSAVQHVVGEGESVDGIRVQSIRKDRVVLRQGSTEEEVWMSFARPGTARSAATGSGDESEAAAQTDVGATDRFGGRRIGRLRWVFKRDALLSYYRELTDEPQRLLKVFDSLKPMYDEQRQITGYSLGVEGEPEFFGSVGLQGGDIVRQVNSLPMTNRQRAEFFIREFVENRANAFVLDVERGGEGVKLVYEVR